MNVSIKINQLERNIRIKYLNFSFKTNIDQSEWIRLFKILKNNNTLIYLNLKGVKLNEECIFHLSESLKFNLHLIYLNLSGVSLNAKSYYYLCEALKINKTLQELDFSGYGFITDRDEKFRYLSEALKVNNTLQKLNLANNHMFNNAICILDVLEINKSLVYLDLSYNKDLFSFIGCRTFFTKLQLNKSLKILYLCRCSIVDYNIYDIAEFLKLNQNLEELNLQNNTLNSDNIVYLIDALNINYTLKKLYLPQKIINKKYLERIDNLLLINNKSNNLQIEFDTKMMNRIIYFKIKWKPVKEIHFMFPSIIRNQIKQLLLISRFHIQYSIPFEIMIYIIEYITSYIDHVPRENYR